MFTKRTMVIGIWLLFVSCIGASLVSAQGFVAVKVLGSEGEVTIHRDASGPVRVQKVAFKANDELFAGDTITTGKNGRLVLGLSDGSQAVVAPKTTLVIQDLRQSPRTLFQMIKGKTRVQIEKLGGQPNPYRVTTPTAVIAVRGTIFDVLVEETETEVFLHEGSVDVFNQALPSQPVFLSAGQTTRVGMRRQPNPPGSFKTGRNDGLFQMRELRNTGDRTNGNQNAGGKNENGRIAQRDQQRDSTQNKPRTTDDTRTTGRNAPPPVGNRPAGGPPANGGTRRP